MLLNCDPIHSKLLNHLAPQMIDISNVNS